MILLDNEDDKLVCQVPFFLCEQPTFLLGLMWSYTWCIIAQRKRCIALSIGTKHAVLKYEGYSKGLLQSFSKGLVFFHRQFCVPIIKIILSVYSQILFCCSSPRNFSLCLSNWSMHLKDTKWEHATWRDQEKGNRTALSSHNLFVILKHLAVNK